MSLIIIIATIWGISALISHIRQARIAKEQMRQREAQARLLREQRAQAQAQREETARLIALEKARQAQDAWNAKQEEINRKNEERLFKLEQKLELAERDERHWSEEVSAIRVDMAGLEGYINYCKSKGLLCKGKEEELAKKRGKLYNAETKLIKARQARELCEMQMGA